MSAPLRIVLVGTGRAARHLGAAIAKGPHTLMAIAGRNAERTKALAGELNTSPADLRSLPPGADLVLIAVSDAAIGEVVRKIGPLNGVVAHTSGASTYDLLLPHPHRGVLWPIQTLGGGDALDLDGVPLAVDGATPQAVEVLERLARDLSGYAIVLGEADRRMVHLAAVLTSNFPVFLIGQAQRLLQRSGLPHDLLGPLWKRTAANVMTMGPEAALTGPARRGDQATIQAHLELLADDTDLREAYRLLSTMIMKAHGHPAP